jgi:hypothetical protein
VKKHTAPSNSVHSWAGTTRLALGLGLAVLAAQTAHAETCPFDNGNSSLAVEGVVLTRYALGITGAPLVANTGINAVDEPTVVAAINCPSCGLNITGNPTMTVADATIISRKLAGFSGPALTNGIALGSGTRNTPAAVQSFLLAGCGATGGTVTSVATGAGLTGGPITGTGTIGLAASQLLPTTTCGDSQTLIWNSTGSNWICAAWAPPGTGANAFVNGGNAFGATAVLGTNDAQTLRLSSGDRLVIDAKGDVDVFAARTYTVIAQTPNGGNGAYSSFVANGPDPSNITSANFTSGSIANENAASWGATISGGGIGRGNCVQVLTGAGDKSCANKIGPNTFASTIAGGYGNDVKGLDGGVISGGVNNSIGRGWSGVIAGGEENFVNAPHATVAGGYGNTAGSSLNGAGAASFVAGGSRNYTRGFASFAAGNKAKALDDHSFVWGGSELGDTNSAGAGTFTAYAPGGFYFFRGIAGAGGCVLPAGVVSWSCTSDRATKSNIQALNPLDTLRRVVAMPVARWNYIGTEKIKNVGPMAQDFFKAFSLGDSDKSIASMNMSGVALSAIQGLNQKLTEQVKSKDAEILALKARLLAIEKRLGL